MSPHRPCKFSNSGRVALVKIKLTWAKLIRNACLLLVDRLGLGAGVFTSAGGVWRS